MTDGTPAPEVREYDFRRPVRILADTRRRFAESLAELPGPLAEVLGARLGTNCELALQDTVEGTSERLFATAFDPVFRLASFTPGGQVYMRLTASLAQAMVERLLGGAGMPREVERELSEIEASLLCLTAGPMRAAIAAAWKIASTTEHAPVHFNAGERHATASVEGASGAFAARLGDATGVLELFCSHVEIARVLGTDGGDFAGGPAGAMTMEHVEDVPVEMAVEWPPTSIRIRDLTVLQVGDIVHLDHKLGDELLVLLGGRAAFRGYPGAVEGAFGVRITRAL